MLKNWLLISAVVLLSTGAFALELNLPSIFADQMALQREQLVPVWGTADAGSRCARMV